MRGICSVDIYGTKKTLHILDVLEHRIFKNGLDVALVSNRDPYVNSVPREINGGFGELSSLKL